MSKTSVCQCMQALVPISFDVERGRKVYEVYTFQRFQVLCATTVILETASSQDERSELVDQLRRTSGMEARLWMGEDCHVSGSPPVPVGEAPYLSGMWPGMVVARVSAAGNVVDVGKLKGWRLFMTP